MTARLVCLDGMASIPIDRPLIIVGRHERCDARVDSPYVSIRHCCLVRVGDGLLIRDLGSSNGTRINGQRIEEGRLGPGDELAIARLRFRLECDAAGPPSPVTRTDEGMSPGGSGSRPAARFVPGTAIDIDIDDELSTDLPFTLYDMTAHPTMTGRKIH